MCVGGYGSSGSDAEDEKPPTPVARSVVKTEAGVKLEGDGPETLPKVEVKEEPQRAGSEEVDYGESSGSESD